MEAVLTEHQGVLDRLMRETAIVPFQFGTILKDKEGAVDHLTSSYATYKELLKKFKDREEWGVRVFADVKKPKSSLSQVHPGTPEKVRSGTAYLLKRNRKKRRKKLSMRSLPLLSGEILNSLKELAFEYKVTKSTQRFSEAGELLISVFALLLPKSKVRKIQSKAYLFTKEISGVGLRLISSGPWSAYNFIS